MCCKAGSGNDGLAPSLAHKLVAMRALWACCMRGVLAHMRAPAGPLGCADHPTSSYAGSCLHSATSTALHMAMTGECTLARGAGASRLAFCPMCAPTVPWSSLRTGGLISLVYGLPFTWPEPLCRALLTRRGHTVHGRLPAAAGWGGPGMRSMCFEGCLHPPPPCNSQSRINPPSAHFCTPCTPYRRKTYLRFRIPIVVVVRVVTAWSWVSVLVWAAESAWGCMSLGRAWDAAPALSVRPCFWPAAFGARLNQKCLMLLPPLQVWATEHLMDGLCYTGRHFTFAVSMITRTLFSIQVCVGSWEGVRLGVGVGMLVPCADAGVGMLVPCADEVPGPGPPPPPNRPPHPLHHPTADACQHRGSVLPPAALLAASAGSGREGCVPPALALHAAGHSDTQRVELLGSWTAAAQLAAHGAGGCAQVRAQAHPPACCCAHRPRWLLHPLGCPPALHCATYIAQHLRR